MLDDCPALALALAWSIYLLPRSLALESVRELEKVEDPHVNNNRAPRRLIRLRVETLRLIARCLRRLKRCEAIASKGKLRKMQKHSCNKLIGEGAVLCWLSIRSRASKMVGKAATLRFVFASCPWWDDDSRESTSSRRGGRGWLGLGSWAG
jgi:hypothetical protein